tara:strand:- start:181 stop:561 length:381 start_codon:yes stop_codon:yes gene_type:complete
LFLKTAKRLIVSEEENIFRIIVQPYAASFDCGSNETLLHGSRRSGLTLFNNCQQGECRKCKVRIREGRVRLGSFMHSALSFEDLRADYTLACRSYPLSNLEIVAELSGWPEERHYSRLEKNSSSND